MTGIVLLYHPSMRSSLLYRKILSNFPDHFSLVIQMPIFPVSRKTQRRNFFQVGSRIRNNFKLVMFYFLTISLFNFFEKISGNSIKSICRRNSIEHHRGKQIDSRILKLVAAKKPAYVISSSTTLLTQEFLDIPTIGTINFHEGKLPEYRGSASYFWNLYNSDRLATSTVMFVTFGLDEGPVIHEAPMRISGLSNMFDVWMLLLLNHRQNWRYVWDFLSEARRLPSIAQKGCAKTYSFPEAYQVRAIQDRGIRLLSLESILVTIQFAIGLQVCEKFRSRCVP